MAEGVHFFRSSRASLSTCGASKMIGPLLESAACSSWNEHAKTQIEVSERQPAFFFGDHTLAVEPSENASETAQEKV